MFVQSLRFGQLDVPDDKVITMARPILGFEHLATFCLVDIEQLRPFLWFQSLEDESVAFLVANPLLFHRGYRIEVNPQEIAELEVREVSSVETYCIVTVPDNPREISANLQGPILVNPETRLAKQLVLVNSPYRVQHYLLDALERADHAAELHPQEELVEL
ncbi:MAG: flagellar assembly protein FliW [candidate division Zixibacteria bacterium]|jgi:flagellar assembly factor FliW|nr:flagellar assembly protein FliW [candidate division Zixibacteria bacterium]